MIYGIIWLSQKARCVVVPKCSKPRKNKDRAKGKGKVTTGKKKSFKNRGRAYVGEWVSNDDEEEEEVQE